MPAASPTPLPIPSPTRTPTPLPTATPTALSQLRHLENWLWIQQQDPKLASTIAELDWVRDGVETGEPAVIQNLLYIAVISRPAASSIVESQWMRDGVNEAEARAVDWMSDIDNAEVLSSVIALAWVQDGIEGAEAGTIKNLSLIANDDGQAGLSLLAFPWIVDGLDEFESSAINLIANFVNPKFSLAMIALSWVRDGIEHEELEALQYLTYIASQDAKLGLSIAPLGWIRDGLDDVERDAVDWMGNFVSSAVASSVIALPWVQDGVGETEVEAIELLSYIANDDAALGGSIAALGWMQDSIERLEAEALEWIGNFESPQVVSSVVSLSWMHDGIGEAEEKAIEYLSYISNLDAAVGLSVASLGWIVDGIGKEEVTAIENLYYVAYEDPAVLASLVVLDWVQEDLGDLEADALEWIGNIQSAEVASSVIALEWMVDGIEDSENRVIEEISYLSFDHPAETLLVLGMQFLESVEHPDVYAVAALSDLAVFKPEVFDSVMSHPGIRAGISDEMSPVVATLYGVADTNPGLIHSLLDPEGGLLEQRSILLPLSGEVALSIIRTGPGAARAMDLLERSVRSIEAYMELPLPTSYIGLLYEDAVVSGFAGTNFGTHMAILPEYDIDDGSDEAEYAPQIIAHEVAHYYWSGNAGWVDEGAADFLASVVTGALTDHPFDASNLPCRHAGNIGELDALGITQDDLAYECSYSLGERLFLDLNRSLGESRFRQNLRRLYTLSEDEDGADEYPGTSVGIERVRQAFGSGDLTADTVIARWYDGAGPFDLSGLDDGPVSRSLPGIDGSIDRAYVALSPDGPAVSSFSLGEVTDWAYLTLKFSYNLPGGSLKVPFEVVEFYEDGFAFERTGGEMVAESRYAGETQWFAVGSPPGEWSTGHYTIYVYAGDRKIAEVQYAVTH